MLSSVSVTVITFRRSGGNSYNILVVVARDAERCQWCRSHGNRFCLRTKLFAVFRLIFAIRWFVSSVFFVRLFFYSVLPCTFWGCCVSYARDFGLFLICSKLWNANVYFMNIIGCVWINWFSIFFNCTLPFGYMQFTLKSMVEWLISVNTQSYN